MIPFMREDLHMMSGFINVDVPGIKVAIATLPHKRKRKKKQTRGINSLDLWLYSGTLVERMRLAESVRQ